MKISYSAFETFNRCPLKYKLGYLDKIKVPEKPEFFFGSLIHEIVEFALKRDPIIPPVEELTAILENKWRADVFPTELVSKQYFEMGVKMLREFHDDYKPGLRNIVVVEKFFQIPLNEKHILSGVIDRVDKLPFGDFEIIDYKTSKQMPTQIEVDSDKQLGIYNLAVEKLWPETKKVKLTLYYLKFNQKLSTTRRADEVEAIRQEIIATAEKIENASEYPPCENSYCAWCDYQNLCPLRKNKIQQETEAMPEEIDDLIEDYILAHEKIKELEPKIHAHFDKEQIEKYFHARGKVLRTKTGRFSVSKPD